MTIHLRSNGKAVVEHPEAIGRALEGLREQRRVVDEDIGMLLREMRKHVPPVLPPLSMLEPVEKPSYRPSGYLIVMGLLAWLVFFGFVSLAWHVVAS